VPGGNVEELIRDLWLVMSELMHQGLTVCVRPERWDDVNIVDFWELMTLLGETPDVVPHGFDLFLPAPLQIPGVTRPHVCALKVIGEDFLEILPTIDWVSRQVVEPSSGCVDQVNGEDLDDEKVVIHPTCPAHEAVVLQPNAGAGSAVVHGDVVGRSKTLRETHVMYIAPERLGPWPIEVKDVPF
jgi:hypothetical protein